MKYDIFFYFETYFEMRLSTVLLQSSHYNLLIMYAAIWLDCINISILPSAMLNYWLYQYWLQAYAAYFIS